MDAPGLVNEDYLRAGRSMSFQDWTPMKGGPIEFVRELAQGALHCSILERRAEYVIHNLMCE